MLNFNSILVSSENPTKLADFYKRVFQKEPEMSDGGYTGFLVGNGFITVGPHDKVRGKAHDPERVILNLETREVKQEFDRIKGLGAHVVAEPYQMEGAWIATLEDPDGNYFQLMTPWEEMSQQQSRN